MFHYFIGKVSRYSDEIFIQNEQFWIQVLYQWKKTEWEFFLYPYLDENRKTVLYYGFDTFKQKQLFESFLKVNGIGGKMALLLANYDQEDITRAVKSMDAKFFQSIPGIWPKTAKKIVLELRDSIDLKQVSEMNLDQKMAKSIVKSLKWFGYETEQVKQVLAQYEGKITDENISDVIKRIISRL